MIGMRAAVCGAAMALWMGQAEAGPPSHEAGPQGHVEGNGAHPEVHGEAHEQGADLHGDHVFHRHHAAIFGGAVFHHGILPAVGLDYCFGLNRLFGLMALAELVFGHEIMQMYGLGLTWQAWGPLRLAVAPALEMEGAHSAFLVRANAECGFHLGGVSIGPSVSADFSDGHVIPVAGLAVGKGF